MAKDKGVKRFHVILVSTNTNSFGLAGFVAIAKDGTAFEAGANSINLPGKRTEIDVFLDDDGNPDYARHGWEIPRELPKAPKNLIDAVWNKTTDAGEKCD